MTTVKINRDAVTVNTFAVVVPDEFRGDGGQWHAYCLGARAGREGWPSGREDTSYAVPVRMWPAEQQRAWQAGREAERRRVAA